MTSIEYRERYTRRLRERLSPVIAHAMAQPAACAVTVVEAVVVSLSQRIPPRSKWRDLLIADSGPVPTCALCGFAIPLDAPPDSDAEFSVDHIVPRCDGGGNLGYDNLQPAHRICNSMRHGAVKAKPRTLLRYAAFLRAIAERYGPRGAGQAAR